MKWITNCETGTRTDRRHFASRMAVSAGAFHALRPKRVKQGREQCECLAALHSSLRSSEKRHACVCTSICCRHRKHEAGIWNYVVPNCKLQNTFSSSLLVFLPKRMRSDSHAFPGNANSMHAFLRANEGRARKKSAKWKIKVAIEQEDSLPGPKERCNCSLQHPHTRTEKHIPLVIIQIWLINTFFQWRYKIELMKSDHTNCPSERFLSGGRVQAWFKCTELQRTPRHEAKVLGTSTPATRSTGRIEQLKLIASICIGSSQLSSVCAHWWMTSWRWCCNALGTEKGEPFLTS